MQIQYFKNKVEIYNLKEFSPKDILTCGQAFRWYAEDDNSYSLVAHNRYLNLRKGEDKITIKGTNKEDFENIWFNYFDLNRDYRKIIDELSKDEIMAKAIDYGRGIRILNQEKFETIISFIISANNGISRIKNSIEIISRLYGEKIYEDEFRKYYRFPTVFELAEAKKEDLREYARVGFRDKRIVDASKMIRDKEVDLLKIDKLNLEDAREELMRLPGVGPKVADCILLFSFNRKESFPVDVWIKRAMEELFLKKETPKKNIAAKGREIFGENAGFAQQYLFYYGRENKLGI